MKTDFQFQRSSAAAVELRRRGLLFRMSESPGVKFGGLALARRDELRGANASLSVRIGFHR